MAMARSIPTAARGVDTSMGSVIYTRVAWETASTGAQVFKVHTGLLTSNFVYTLSIFAFNLFIPSRDITVYTRAGDLNHTNALEAVSAWMAGYTSVERLRRRFLEGFLEARFFPARRCLWLAGTLQSPLL